MWELKSAIKIFSVFGTCLALLTIGCSRQDEQRKELMAAQINMIDKQVQSVDEGRAKLTARADNLDDLIAQMNSELDKAKPRLQAVREANGRLRGLFFGPKSKPGIFDPGDSIWNTTNLLIVAVLVLGLWILWRMREQKLETAMNREVDQVINRLSDKAERMNQEDAISTEDKLKPEQDVQQKSESIKGQETPEPDKTKEYEDKNQEKAETSEPPAEEIKKSVPEKKKKPEKKETRKRPQRSPAKKCKVKGCNNKHRSKGFCNKHYQQWRRGTLTEELEE